MTNKKQYTVKDGDKALKKGDPEAAYGIYKFINAPKEKFVGCMNLALKLMETPEKGQYSGTYVNSCKELGIEPDKEKIIQYADGLVNLANTGWYEAAINQYRFTKSIDKLYSLKKKI